MYGAVIKKCSITYSLQLGRRMFLSWLFANTKMGNGIGKQFKRFFQPLVKSKAVTAREKQNFDVRPSNQTKTHARLSYNLRRMTGLASK